MIEAVTSALYGLALLTVLALVTTSFGMRVLNRCGWLAGATAALRLGVAAGAGLAVLAYLVFFLGLCGFVGALWSLVAMVSVLLFSLPSGIADTLQELKAMRAMSLLPTERFAFRIVLGVVILAAAAFFVLALAPPSSADTLKCHLSLCRYFLHVGRIEHLDSLRYSGVPFLGQMLYLWGLSLGSEAVTGLINWFYNGLLALVVYGYASQGGKPLGGIMGAALVYLMPVTMVTTIATGSDLFVAFYVSTTLLVLVGSRGEMLWRNAILIGALAGAAMSCKTNALLLAIPVFLLAAGKAVWVRKRMVTTLGAIAASCAIVALPMYLRTWAWTGNPFYPVAFPLAEKVTLLKSFAGNAAGVGARQLRPKTLTDALRVPYDLVFDAQRLCKSPAETGSGLTPSVLGLLPLALLAGRSLAFLPLFGSLLFQWGIYGIGGVSARYFWPGEPAVAAGVGAGIGMWLAARSGRWQWPVLGLVLLGATQTLTVTAFYLRNMAPVVFGLERRDDYLRRNTPYYQVWEWVNKELPPNEMILAKVTATYYLRQPHAILDGSVGTYRTSQSAEQLRAAFHRARVRYVILDEQGADVSESLNELRQAGALVKIKGFSEVYIGGRNPVRRKPETTHMAVYAFKETVAPSRSLDDKP